MKCENFLSPFDAFAHLIFTNYKVYAPAAKYLENIFRRHFFEKTWKSHLTFFLVSGGVFCHTCQAADLTLISKQQGD